MEVIKISDKPAGIRIERSIWEDAEKMRQIRLKEGDPAAMSPQSWFSNLVSIGMIYYRHDSIRKKIEDAERGD
jgi:hypothetical protein